MLLATMLENTCSIYTIIIIKLSFIVNTPPISSGIRRYPPEYWQMRGSHFRLSQREEWGEGETWASFQGGDEM